MSDSKQWALAFLLYAQDHRNQFPKSFDELKGSRYVRGMTLSESNLEVVSWGSISRFKQPMITILLKERNSRQSPDHKYVKAYTFADGHVELLTSADDDFESMEKERGFLAMPDGN